jgi:hypothetical protein
MESKTHWLQQYLSIRILGRKQQGERQEAA